MCTSETVSCALPGLKLTNGSSSHLCPLHTLIPFCPGTLFLVTLGANCPPTLSFLTPHSITHSSSLPITLYLSLSLPLPHLSFYSRLISKEPPRTPILFTSDSAQETFNTPRNRCRTCLLHLVSSHLDRSVSHPRILRRCFSNSHILLRLLSKSLGLCNTDTHTSMGSFCVGS